MRARFATTRWSLVLAARDDPSDAAREAFGQLCRTYWEPVYCFLRRRGSEAEEARDLTQAFFTRLLEKRTLGVVSPERGRFRSFLLVSARHFLADSLDRERAVKRGAGATPIPLSPDEAEEGYLAIASGDASPEVLYERRWAQRVVARALERLRREMEADGRADRWTELSPFLVDDDGAPYRRIAERLGTTEAAVKVAVGRLRRSFGRALREEVAETTGDPADVDEELRHLLAVVR